LIECSIPYQKNAIEGMVAAVRFMTGGVLFYQIKEKTKQ